MNIKSLVFVSLLFAGSTGIVQAQGGHVGGGDHCKNEIDKHRVAIRNWILQDEAEALDFSIARVKGWTYNDPTPAKSYKRSMLSVLADEAVIVTCYLDPARIKDPVAREIAEREGVSYKAITIGKPGKPVACINYEDSHGRSHIDCNYDLIMHEASIGDRDYVTTHHEFASIVGVEERTKPGSYSIDYSISNQLSRFAHYERVKVLGASSPIEAMKRECALGNSSPIFGYWHIPVTSISETFKDVRYEYAILIPDKGGTSNADYTVYLSNDKDFTEYVTAHSIKGMIVSDSVIQIHFESGTDFYDTWIGIFPPVPGSSGPLGKERPMAWGYKNWNYRDSFEVDHANYFRCSRIRSSSRLK